MGGQPKRYRLLLESIGHREDQTHRHEVHFLKTHVEHGTIRLRYLPTGQMVADMFIKPLQGPALTRHRSAILGDAEPMQRFTM
jgi:uncharacterized membrane protein